MEARSSNGSRDAKLIEQLLDWGDAPRTALPEGQRTEALQQLLEVALDLCGADSGSLMVVDDEGRELRAVVSRGLRVRPEEAPPIRVGDPIAGRIAKTGAPVLLRSEHPSAELGGFLSRRDEIRTAACVPCRTEGRVTGVLTVNQRWSGHAEMDQTDVNRLQVLADHAASDVLRLSALSPKTGTLETRWIADPQAQARIDRLANLGVVAGGIAHEINNPLQGAIGLTEVILQQHDTQTEEERERDLIALREDLYRLADIVSNLLSFVRESRSGPSMTLHVVDCLEFAARSALTQNATAQIECERRYDPAIPAVGMHPSHLRQVLLNLTINAVQAMGKRGQLRLGLSTSGGGAFVDLTVADTGPGISETEGERVFEPGFTTKADGNGTGLGLAVSRNLARESGGDLIVRRGAEGGAEFVLRVPAVA